jgi:hypothetical protein
VLAEQGWKRPEDHEGDVGTICWEKIFDSELSTGNAAVTAAAQFAVDRLAETYAVALPTPSGRQRGPEKLDLLWLAIEVDLRISR